MRIIAFLLAVTLAAPAYSQITIGRYRVNGSIEFNADLQIEEVVPMATIPDPIAGWNFSDNTAEYGSFDLTLVNSPTFNTGKLGDAIYLERASEQYAKIANASAGILKQSSTDWISGGGVTLTGWVYPTSTPAIRHSIAATGDAEFGSGGTAGWMLSYGQDRKVSLHGRSNLVLSSTGNLLTNNQWNFVAFRLDADNVLTLQVNGGSVNQDFGASALWDASSADFNIGQADNGSFGMFGATLNPAFDGRIDATYIWDSALSDAQIAALYNSGDGVELPLPIDPVPEANLHSAVSGACERRTEVQRSCETSTAVSQSNVLRKTVTVPHPQ